MKDASVDNALAVFVFCNIAARMGAVLIMKNVFRALRPGGRFIILNANWEDCNGREFISYKVDRVENPASGQKVCLIPKSPPLKVENYLWSAPDYQWMLKEAGFDTAILHKPLANGSAAKWRGENEVPLFLIPETAKNNDFLGKGV